MILLYLVTNVFLLIALLLLSLAQQYNLNFVCFGSTRIRAIDEFEQEGAAALYQHTMHCNQPKLFIFKGIFLVLALVFYMCTFIALSGRKGIDELQKRCADAFH